MPHPSLMFDSCVEQLIQHPAFAHGMSREVFWVPTNSAVIAKRQIIRFPGANILEWILWNAVKKTPLADIFGECVAISETGQYLIMERLDDISKSDWPSVPKVSGWLNDKKPSAFGKNADGVIKVRDYAMVDLDRAMDTHVLPVPWAISSP